MILHSSNLSSTSPLNIFAHAVPSTFKELFSILLEFIFLIQDIGQKCSFLNANI